MGGIKQSQVMWWEEVELEVINKKCRKDFAERNIRCVPVFGIRGNMKRRDSGEVSWQDEMLNSMMQRRWVYIRLILWLYLLFVVQRCIVQRREGNGVQETFVGPGGEKEEWFVMLLIACCLLLAACLLLVSFYFFISLLKSFDHTIWDGFILRVK